MNRKQFECVVLLLGEEESECRLLDAAMNCDALFQDKYNGDTEAIQDIFGKDVPIYKEKIDRLWKVFIMLHDEFEMDAELFLKGKDIK